MSFGADDPAWTVSKQVYNTLLEKWNEKESMWLVILKEKIRLEKRRLQKQKK